MWGLPTEKMQEYDISHLVDSNSQNLYRLQGSLEILNFEQRTDQPFSTISTYDCDDFGVFRAHHLIFEDNKWNRVFSSESFISNDTFNVYPAKKDENNDIQPVPLIPGKTMCDEEIGGYTHELQERINYPELEQLVGNFPSIYDISAQRIARSFFSNTSTAEELLSADTDECAFPEMVQEMIGCTSAEFRDSDGDGVLDNEDECPGFDDFLDSNSNKIPHCAELEEPFEDEEPPAIDSETQDTADHETERLQAVLMFNSDTHNNIYGIRSMFYGCLEEELWSMQEQKLICRGQKCSQIGFSPIYSGPVLSFSSKNLHYIWNAESDHYFITSAQHIGLGVRLPPLQEGDRLQPEYLFPISKPGEPLVVAISESSHLLDITEKEPKGFEIDLVYDLAKRMGKTDVQFIRSADPQKEAQDRTVDLAIGSLKIHTSKEEQPLSSIPYLSSKDVIVMRKRSRITTDLLSKMKCGHHSVLHKENLQRQNCTIKSYNDTTEALKGLRTNEIDYMILDQKQVPQDLWHSKPIDFRRYGLFLHQKEIIFKLLVDRLIDQMEQDGTIQDLRSKYNMP